MSKYKVALFDVDGVVIIPPKPFSVVYAEEHDLNPEDLTPFFKGDFVQALKGKADLKDLIHKNVDIWHWYHDPAELLHQWFESEDYPNNELIDIIQDFRSQGLRSYMATNQEQYRTKYLLENTLFNKFDGIFAAYEIGYVKAEGEYWEAVLQKLKMLFPDVTPAEIVYFDDNQGGLDKAGAQGIATYLYTDNEHVKVVLAEQ